MLPEDGFAKRHENVDSSPAQTFMLSFLQGSACKGQRTRALEERALLHRAQQALKQAESVIICLGGRAGRLGECIVGTGLLEGVLLALRAVGRAGTPVSLLIDSGAVELFEERLYQARCWPQMHVFAVPPGQMPVYTDRLIRRSVGRRCLVVDAHGAQDGMPYLRVEEQRIGPSAAGSDGAIRTVTTLGRLFRVGVRSYAQRGPGRRYADFIEELFDLPAGTINGALAQPRIWLSAADAARFPTLAAESRLQRSAILVVCFFQSIVPAKCYGRWREVMTTLCQQMARRAPRQQIDFLLACGPDEDLPPGVKLADVAAEFADFTGANGNARALVRATPSLRDLAIMVRHAALVLSNDTGPGHLAGALRVPTIVPYLPGQVYSRAVWASTPWHHGVTLEPSPFPAQQIEAAVLQDKTEIIDSIPAESLKRKALDHLVSHVLSDDYKTLRSSATPDGRARSTSAARCRPRRREGEPASHSRPR
jgi:hypothetical protein